MPSIAEIDFRSYAESVPVVFDLAKASDAFKEQSAVLIKPNLVNASRFPITTAVECVEAVVGYVRSCSQAEIVVGEGSGDPNLSTTDVFQRLGYVEMAERLNVELIDLNEAPLRRLENADCPVFPEMYLPEIVFSNFLISVPVLKAHSLAEITGTLKNMIGLAPPAHYSGRYGTWKKAVFHNRMQEAIVDLNRYRTPDFTLMDASVGMPDFHLGGAHCEPPLNRLLAGGDPKAIDRRGAELLGMRWQSIGHLA